MRTTETERLLVERLSRLLDSEDGASVLALVQRLRRARTPGPMPAGRADCARRLGVWEVLEDGSLQRDRALGREWRAWADVDRVPARRRRRVVLVGESVARGYLYDPELTPAAALQDALDQALDGPGVEIVDLARTDLSLAGLVDLVERVHLLEPDAVVVWAGHRDLSSDDFAVLSAALRRDGAAAVGRAFLERCVRPRSEAALDAVGAASKRLGVPVLCVVPESNLLDWREPDVVLPVAAPPARLVEARAAAEAARASGRHEECLCLAREWVALSEGTSPAAHRLAGLALLAMGQPERARASLEAARDAVCGVLTPHAPRCPRTVEDVIRTRAQERGLAVVDLPAVLARERPHGLPDRGLFLDYCHLSLRGIELAVGAIASELTRLLGLGAAGSAWPAGRAEPAVEATAHFMAAVHNAHYPQPFDIVDHHCQRAVDLWPAAGRLMLALLDSERRRAPSWLCGSFAELRRSRIAQRCLGADVHLRNKHLDLDLVASVARALDRIGLAGDQALRAWVDEHGDPERPVDLLDPWHRPASFRERVGDSFWPGSSHYRAFEPETRFNLARGEATGLRLELTCRVPGVRGTPRPARVAVNGHVVAEIPCTESWGRHAVAVGGELIRAGCNEVLIAWPDSAPDVGRRLAGAAHRLDGQELPCLLHVFGEIDRLRAVPAGPAPLAAIGREAAVLGTAEP